MNDSGMMKNEAQRISRIVLILPCCIGDVVIATAVLSALRRAYPQSHITWAVGGWSRHAVEHHPDLNAILDTGAAALPVKSIGGFARFVGQLRGGHFDLAVSLVRSPLMSAAVWLSGIPRRAGLDSNGRGFGYNIRAAIDPDVIRHEGEIYLDVPRALGLDTSGCYAHVPISEPERSVARRLLPDDAAFARGFIMINPAGGRNPGMVMDSKRYPPNQLAELANQLYARYELPYVLIGAKSDRPILDALTADLRAPYRLFAGDLSFQQIAALAALSAAYIGSDTGLTHLAAAAGAKTIMILGPTDPARYAPFTAPDQSLTLWKPYAVAGRGVAAGDVRGWDWVRDGISVSEAYTQITNFLGTDRE